MALGSIVIARPSSPVILRTTRDSCRGSPDPHTLPDVNTTGTPASARVLLSPAGSFSSRIVTFTSPVGDVLTDHAARLTWIPGAAGEPLDAVGEPPGAA